jgi:hypothetical protein
VHHVHRHAGARDAGQRGRSVRRERLGALLVAEPAVEQIAEDVDRARLARRAARPRGERLRVRRARGGEVQVGQEVRGRQGSRVSRRARPS